MLIAGVAVLGPGLAESARTQPRLVLAVLVLAGLPAVVNLMRYRRAPGGCVALPLGFFLCGLAWALDRPGLERAAAFLLPNLLFLLLDLGIRPALRWQAARAALSELGRVPDARSVTPFLAHEAARVREAAGEALLAWPLDDALRELGGALRSEDPRVRAAGLRALRAQARRERAEARVGELLEEVARAGAEGAAEAAGLLPELDPAGERSARVGADAADAAIRVALGEGLVRAGRVGQVGSLCARLLVGVLVDPGAAPELRERALEAALAEEGAPEPGELLAVARGCPVEEPTAEHLWLLAERGEAEDAARAAAHVAAQDYPRAHAAVEAVSAIVARASAQELGATREALTAGRARLREVHPPGDNRLADGLVDQLELLIEELSPSAPG